MQKDKIVVYTIADNKNLKYALNLEKSFKHFYPEIKFVIFDQEYLDKFHLLNDPEFFYKATPYFTRQLLKEYELVVKIDADSILTGKIDSVFEDTSYDVGSVLNNNDVEPKVSLTDLPWQYYLNCGFVAIRSQEFADHWWKLCYAPFFRKYQYREQDMLNILFAYGNYNFRNFDLDGENKLYGLASKGFWTKFKVKDGKLILPQGKQVGVDKQIVCIHNGGGSVENKLNLDRIFLPEVAEYIKNLIK